MRSWQDHRAESGNVSQKKAIVIANPAAGRNDVRGTALKARNHLEAHNWSADLVFTAPQVSVADKPGSWLSKRYAGTVDRVVVIGGDGTLREVVSGLGDEVRQTTVAFIPLGNANVTARQFNFPRDIEANIATITNSTFAAMDVGRVNGDVFLAMVGVGYDALVTAMVGAARSTRPGRWFYSLRAGGDVLYVLSGLMTGLRLLPRKFDFHIDGTSASRAYPTIWISNTRTYAKSWSVTPAASINDGRLDFHACKYAGLIRPLIVMRRAVHGKPAPASISEYGTVTTCRIQSDKPFRWQMDGDPMPATDKLDIEVIPHHFRIVVPE